MVAAGVESVRSIEGRSSCRPDQFFTTKADRMGMVRRFVADRARQATLAGTCKIFRNTRPRTAPNGTAAGQPTPIFRVGCVLLSWLPACHAGGREFESRRPPPDFARVHRRELRLGQPSGWPFSFRAFCSSEVCLAVAAQRRRRTAFSNPVARLRARTAGPKWPAV